MTKRFVRHAFPLAVVAILFAQLATQAEAFNCNNPNYAPPNGEVFVLCNDPLGDGLFTEDGVTGYQYIFDLYIGMGCCGTFMLGGDLGPLGAAGTFDSQASAWYRASAIKPHAQGVWQSWGSSTVTDTSGTVSRADNGPIGSLDDPMWTLTDGAALGDSDADVWETSVVHSVEHPDALWNGGWFGTDGLPIPWARDNIWHAPSEYGYSSMNFYPGFILGTAGQDPTKGLAWRADTGIYWGGDVALTHTVRIVSPYEPGSINWYHDNNNNGVITGPSGAPVPQITCDGIVGDANCDGYVDVGNDIFPAFSNFTGPGSFGMERAQGDVQGNATGATANLDPHDGDVDVSDIITMFSNFTGPAPPSDEAGGLVAAEALDSTIPDLIYDASTGEVLLDLDSAVGFTGYVLNSANGFITGNHTPFMAGVTTTLPYELAEATFGTPAGPYPKSIGNVFPSGMDMAALSAFLTGNQVSRGNNQPIVPFDLVIINGVIEETFLPEPAAVVMGLMALAGLGMVAYRRRRNG